MNLLTTRLLFSSAVLSAAFCCAQDVRSAAPITAVVVRAHDADTLTVQLKLRIHYIDAPELNQPHGKESAAATSELLKGSTITFVPVGRSYDRTVADVQLGGLDVARLLVEDGHAMLDPRFKPPQVLLDAAADAKAERLGVWRVPEGSNPEPPWEFRRRGKRK